jgi:lysophospholipase L1-like esterase
MPQSNKKKTIAETLSGKSITLVALGDSNTGINHWTHGELNWLSLLACLLACNYRTCFPDGCTIINSGRSGDTATGGLARLQKDVLRFSPDLVIIGFGTNDAAISDNLEKFRKDMRSMILQLKNVGCEILLRTPPPVVNMNDGSELLEIPGQPGSIRDIAAYAKEISIVA